MDAIKQVYIEEANELLVLLESSLLELESNANEAANIEQVFRVMHTLKGNSSIFGLNVISDFVHNLESIYDAVRTGELGLKKNLLDYTFRALDLLKEIIYDSELKVDKNKTTYTALMLEIEQIISRDTRVVTEEIQQATETTAIKTYHIYFEPHSNILKDGSQPLCLLSELATLGKSRVFPHFKSIASIEDFIPTQCISYWDIFIETTLDKKALADVFIFVADKSLLKISEVPFPHLMKNSRFMELANSTINNDCSIDVEEIMALINSESISPAGDKDEVKTGKSKEQFSIRIPSEKLDELLNLVSELVTSQASLSLYTQEHDHGSTKLGAISENIEKLSRKLRDAAFGMTLVPINNMFSRFQRMVRDLSASLGKEVQFVSEGGETELDKAIIEKLTDPIMHIIRNSLDHGIESVEERIRLGKPEVGKISMKAYYTGAFVYVQISDDGKGIDKKAVYEKAVQKGLINKTDVLSDKEIYDLIFHSGFSTTQAVTDISGRGVGMDVVKQNVASIRGTVFVDSHWQQGTGITIKLPLTLTIIDGLLVSINQVKYIIPLSVVVKCYEVENRVMANNFNNLLILDGEQIPYINLREELGYEADSAQYAQVIVVNNADKKVGLSIDFIIDEYQAVIKPLGKHYKKQDFISGATILGDGTVALVLDTYKLIELHIKNKV